MRRSQQSIHSNSHPINTQTTRIHKQIYIITHKTTAYMIIYTLYYFYLFLFDSYVSLLFCICVPFVLICLLSHKCFEFVSLTLHAYTHFQHNRINRQTDRHKQTNEHTRQQHQLSTSFIHLFLFICFYFTLHYSHCSLYCISFSISYTDYSSFLLISIFLLFSFLFVSLCCFPVCIHFPPLFPTDSCW